MKDSQSDVSCYFEYGSNVGRKIIAVCPEGSICQVAAVTQTPPGEKADNTNLAIKNVVSVKRIDSQSSGELIESSPRIGGQCNWIKVGNEYEAIGYDRSTATCSIEIEQSGIKFQESGRCSLTTSYATEESLASSWSYRMSMGKAIIEIDVISVNTLKGEF
jgi:hypothetical protein